jgi:hypothetical protein
MSRSAAGSGKPIRGGYGNRRGVAGGCAGHHRDRCADNGEAGGLLGIDDQGPTRRRSLAVRVRHRQRDGVGLWSKGCGAG